MTNWQTIVSKYSPLVWRTTYRLLGNHADAADCLQETFVSALVVSRRQRVRNWPGLLRKLATTRAIERLRQRLRQADRCNELADWAAVPCDNPGPVQRVEDIELAGRLRRALAALPPQQAEVFCLRCVDGMSYREIARALGIKSNAVGTLLQRARWRLRARLRSLPAEQES